MFKKLSLNSFSYKNEFEDLSHTIHPQLYRVYTLNIGKCFINSTLHKR